MYHLQVEQYAPKVVNEYREM